MQFALFCTTIDNNYGKHCNLYLYFLGIYVKLEKEKICLEIWLALEKYTGHFRPSSIFTSMFHIFFGMGRSRANVINMTSKVRMSVRCYHLLIPIGLGRQGKITIPCRVDGSCKVWPWMAGQTAIRSDIISHGGFALILTSSSLVSSTCTRNHKF